MFAHGPPRIRLQEHERAGGHTIARHVGWPTAALKLRLAQEPEIPAASSFPDLATAEYHVANALNFNHSALMPWLQAPSRRLWSCSYDAEIPVGHGCIRGLAASVPMTKLKLILQRSPHKAQACFVLTAFPIT